MKQIYLNSLAWLIEFLKKIFGQKQKPDLQYFLPGEIVFQIRHPVAATPEETRNNVVNALRDFLQPTDEDKQQTSSQEPSPGQTWRNRLTPPTAESRVITFPFLDDRGRVFSLVPIQINGYDVENNMDPKEAISILRDAYADFQQGGSLELDKNFSIQSISPNWLTSDLHHGSATGGPGSRPTRAPAPPRGDQRFDLVSASSLISPAAIELSKENVYVAILDTAPSTQARDNAYHDRGNHRLVQRLFGSNGRLNVQPGDRATLNSLVHYSPALHDYPMPDHGTFIAGIIHTIAPNAIIHLYEVLNSYGVGSFTSVAQGILDAINNPEIGRPLVINCSFMFCLPDGDAGTGLVDDLGVSIKDLTTPTGLLTRTMREIFDNININDPLINVVASAGNNASPSAGRLPARYPAAFKNVKGIGALQKRSATGQYPVASYSNFADDPPEDGFMAFGGEPGGAGYGILGMYISGFPDRTPNNTGWAWWAGTSFAAAVVSGLLAANHGGFPEVTAFRPGPGDLTPQGEKIIKVEQIY